ncbi:VOC family protein [Nocardia sp. GCM10030253]|uniref:VOC family protein n=1 Tax=Nocardia sp. GCM10030253 TaxID=3273404 RepID=UPI003642895A
MASVIETVHAAITTVIRYGDDQSPPRPPDGHRPRGVHHLGIVIDELEGIVERLRAHGISVTDIRHEPTASYAMARGPDQLLVEIFQPGLTTIPTELRAYFGLPDRDPTT